MPVAVVIRRTTGPRVGIGSLPPPLTTPTTRPAASGTILVEQDVAAGDKLRVVCWRRELPGGNYFLSVELKAFNVPRRRA